MTYLCIPHQGFLIHLLLLWIALAGVFPILLRVVLICDIRKRAADPEESGQIRKGCLSQWLWYGKDRCGSTGTIIRRIGGF